jgi:integrase
MATALLQPHVYQADRPLHHQLALDAYQQSFERRNLTPKHKKTQLRRLDDVFRWVQIGDPLLSTVQRPVDTFDLTNPRLSAKIRDAIYRDIPSRPRAIACLKAVDHYCRFLRDNPMVYQAGQQAIHLPDLYGAIVSPVNRYTIPRQPSERGPNHLYLLDSEYRQWLRFTYSAIKRDLPAPLLLKMAQRYLMCVIAGEMGLRLQELLGLQLKHFNMADGVCLVVCGKGTKGSGHRKRQVTMTPLVKATLKDFLTLFPRNGSEPLIQNDKGQWLSINTAHHWMRELIGQIEQAKLPIIIEKGFGWHAFRRTWATRWLRHGGSLEELKRQGGWSWTSTLSHYLGDSKNHTPKRSMPLYVHSSRGDVPC